MADHDLTLQEAARVMEKIGMMVVFDQDGRDFRWTKPCLFFSPVKGDSRSCARLGKKRVHCSIPCVFYIPRGAPAA